VGEGRTLLADEYVQLLAPRQYKFTLHHGTPTAKGIEVV
jgi:hypothetical protein